MEGVKTSPGKGGPCARSRACGTGIAPSRRGRLNHLARFLCVATVAIFVPVGGRAAVGASTSEEKGLVRAVQSLEGKLGFRHTKNFRKISEEAAAAYRCYYTGKLELPDSYEGLQLRLGTAAGCPLDGTKYDVFYYPLEAKASGRTPITASLAGESVERFLVVIPHEDFHSTPELKKLPPTLTEAASTLVGFLTAMEVARRQFGIESEVYRNLEREPELFCGKAGMVNVYHARLRKLYAAWRAGEISKESALAQKQQIFEKLHEACQAALPDPKSFNKCPAVNNNAGLAFDATYTRDYPLVYDLYVAKGRELGPTVSALRHALAAGTEQEAVQNLEALAKRFSGGPFTPFRAGSCGRPGETTRVAPTQSPATAAGLPATPPGAAAGGSPSCYSPSLPLP